MRSPDFAPGILPNTNSVNVLFLARTWSSKQCLFSCVLFFTKPSGGFVLPVRRQHENAGSSCLSFSVSPCLRGEFFSWVAGNASAAPFVVEILLLPRQKLGIQTRTPVWKQPVSEQYGTDCKDPKPTRRGARQSARQSGGVDVLTHGVIPS